MILKWKAGNLHIAYTHGTTQFYNNDTLPVDAGGIPETEATDIDNININHGINNDANINTTNDNNMKLVPETSTNQSSYIIFCVC